MPVDAVRLVSLFLQQVEHSKPAWQPAADIYRLPTGWLVKMELAGVTAEDVQLNLRGRTLVVSGRRRDCCPDAGCRQSRMEIEYGRFEREIELPGDWQRATIETHFDNGMMLIRILKEVGV
ncbi:MAG: Hsp20/alpha crystallin family protein [Gemmataceae bacterium]|nr:Hsp20/alpha crystallin family protein [Gemmataceae bacterium]